MKETSHPEAGTRAAENKSTDPGPFKYRFSTSTPVTTAKEVKGAAQKCLDKQVGSNMSKLPKQVGDCDEE